MWANKRRIRGKEGVASIKKNAHEVGRCCSPGERTAIVSLILRGLAKISKCQISWKNFLDSIDFCVMIPHRCICSKGKSLASFPMAVNDIDIVEFDVASVDS